MNLVTRVSVVLGVGLMLGAAGCSVHWVVPIIEETAPESEEADAPEGREGPSTGEEADDGAPDRAEREREARESGAEDEAEEEGDRRAERTEEREDEEEEETDRDAVERAEAERELREGDGDDEDAVERARAEREAREGARDEEDEADGDEDGGPGEEADPDGDGADEGDDGTDDADAPGDDGAEDADDDPGDQEGDEGDDPDGTAGPDEPDAPDPEGPARRRVDVPPGHLPPEGQCRIWYDGVPPGLQAPAAPCGEPLDMTLADGAFLLYADEDWDLEFEWEAVEAAHPGSVPDPVLAFRERYVERGDEDEDDELPEPREADVPAGHFPGDGMCRVWLEGIPAGQQADPVPCDTLEASDLEDGAFLLHDGKAWDAEHDWAAEALRNPGSVPEMVLEILGN